MRLTWKLKWRKLEKLWDCTIAMLKVVSHNDSPERFQYSENKKKIISFHKFMKQSNFQLKNDVVLYHQLRSNAHALNYELLNGYYLCLYEK